MSYGNNSEKITVTVGIPAYNEEANIGALLKSVLSQTEDNFILEEIVINLDGSTDGTAGIVRSFRDPRIRLIESKNRAGKPSRINELFGLSKSRVFVQFDADILPGHGKVISELVKYFIRDGETAMVCGGHRVRRPERFVEKAAAFGVKVWEDAVAMLGSEGGRYRCTGQIRAFSKKFLKTFRVAEELGSGEDTYSFYAAAKAGVKVVFAPEAWVYYRLAGTLEDYIKQTGRFIYAENQMRRYFGAELSRRYETMNAGVMAKAFVKNIFRESPRVVAGFIALHAITRIKALAYRHKVAWDIATSSKKF